MEALSGCLTAHQIITVYLCCSLGDCFDGVLSGDLSFLQVDFGLTDWSFQITQNASFLAID